MGVYEGLGPGMHWVSLTHVYNFLEKIFLKWFHFLRIAVEVCEQGAEWAISNSLFIGLKYKRFVGKKCPMIRVGRY